MLEIRHNPCLILNQDYRPLLVINWKRAICLDIVGKGVRVISYYEDDIVISAGGQEFYVPAVAVCNHYVKRCRKITLKKHNLLVRDERQCQYCGDHVQPQSSTIDHVKPRSHFNNPNHAHTWENTVIACGRCNSAKGNRTPKQANMRLLTVPKEPEHGTFYIGMSPWQSTPEEWWEFIKV